MGTQSPLQELKASIPGIGDDQDILLAQLLARAEDFILAYTYRDKLPDNSARWQALLALLYYNRVGVEGESAHSEGGVSRSIDALPADLQRWLDAHRLLPGVLRARRAASAAG